MAKQGSTVAGLTEAFGRAISYALQYQVPLPDLVRNFSHMRFEPMGRTENRDIPVAQSIIDYVFRWLASRYMSPQEAYEVGVMTPEIKAALAAGQYPLPTERRGWRGECERQRASARQGGRVREGGRGRAGDLQRAARERAQRCARVRELRLDHDQVGDVLPL